MTLVVDGPRWIRKRPTDAVGAAVVLAWAAIDLALAARGAVPVAVVNWLGSSVISGVGLALAALAVRCLTPTVAGWVGGAGVLLLAVPVLGAAAGPRPAGASAAAALALLLPLGLLRVPPRAGATMPARLMSARLMPARLLLAADALVGAAGVSATAGTLATRWPLTLWSVIASVTVLVVLGWVHVELSAGSQRRRLLWLVIGTAFALFGALAVMFVAEGTPLPPAVVDWLIGLVGLALPAGLVIAVRDPAWVDVRRVVADVLVWVSMGVLGITVWAGVEAALTWSGWGDLRGGQAGLVATMVAAGFHPVLVRVRTTIDELLFGGRPDPVDALTRLGSDFTAGSTPDEWLRTLRAVLGVPFIEIRTSAGSVAESGTDPGTDDAVTPLRVGDVEVGELVVRLTTEQLAPTPAARTVLRLVAGPLAQALHATRLADELRASRGRVVAALEEERRRVRRDLHDGLGPTLTGIAYSADAATNLVATDPASAAQLLRELRSDAGDAIAEVRRIVYGLRPRALDELGLVGAVRQHVARLHRADGRPLAVELTAPDSLPALPAAVEVAAFRVAVEAVTNVARHAATATARVELAADDEALAVTVTDGGCASTWQPGVGLTTMRDRVEELGGVLVVTPARGRVEARLPLSPVG